MISLVIDACRTLFICSVILSISSAALFVAASIAVMRAADRRFAAFDEAGVHRPECEQEDDGDADQQGTFNRPQSLYCGDLLNYRRGFANNGGDEFLGFTEDLWNQVGKYPVGHRHHYQREDRDQRIGQLLVFGVERRRFIDVAFAVTLASGLGSPSHPLKV